MKFEIKHRISGTVLFRCELTAEFETKALQYLIGAAIKLATKARADLTGADLRGAYLTGADLRGADLRGAYLTRADLTGADLRGADLRGAYLTGADLTGADLTRADLRGADLTGADLIDGGHDGRGYRFWAWRHEDGHFVYRAGCQQWHSIEDARAHYGADYNSDGNVAICLARLDVMRAEIEGREWPEVG